MLKYVITADFENWERISEEIVEYLTEMDYNRRNIISFMVAAEEIFVNIAQYAYGGKTGKVEVRFDISADGTAKIEFWDNGIKFDPTKAKEPLISASIREKDIGGMGIYMAKKKTDAMLYEYKNGRNHLTVLKKL
ncbi:MAG: ATP-binding protein [Clostridiales bacterium]|nr:ATP-binding protein [Clostridiales bacterium]